MIVEPSQLGEVAAGLVVRASLLIAIAGLVASALRKASPAKRSLAWLLCMSGLVVLPLLHALLPSFEVPLLPSHPSGLETTPAEAPQLGDEASGALLDWRALILGAYLLGAGLLLVRFLAARLELARLWRNSTTASDPEWVSLVDELRAELRLSRKIRLRIADRAVMPMTWGSLAPKVLVPAEVRGWSLERRRQVLLHELAHVARFDSLGRSISSIACALYWFHPWAWLASRRLRLEQELTADSLVLAAGEPPAAYASSLLELAHELGGNPRHAVAATMAGKWQLERRIVAMANPASRAGPGALGLCAVALAATLASALIAPVHPSLALRAPARPAAPDATSLDNPPTAAQAPAQRMGPVRTAAPGAASARSEVPSTRDVEASSRASSNNAPQPRSEFAAQPQAPAPQPIPQMTDQAKYGPQLPASQPADDTWRLRPSKADRTASGIPVGAGDEADAAKREKPRGPFRLPLQIIPSVLGRTPIPSPTQPGARTTMVSWLVGSKP